MAFIQSIIAEYEDTLIGKRKSISPFYFSYGETGNMKLALQVMKYAFETYLQWSPQDLQACLTYEVLERLHLKSLLRYVVFPPELDVSQDLFYIAWLLYPETLHFDQKDLILRVYQKLLEGRQQKFPKEFFTGSDGLTRSQVCLRYMIEQYLTFSSIKDMYAFFAAEACHKVLRKYKLLVVCRDLYDTPVDYLHASLARGQQDEFWYRYYDFQLQRRRLAEQQAGNGAI